MDSRILAGTLLLLAPAIAPAGPRPAQIPAEASTEVPTGIPMARAEVTERVVAALKRLAKWCNQAELFRRRDAALRSVLEFEPEDAEARRFLKYRREKDGSWTQPRPYKEPRDLGTSKLAEQRKLCADLLRGIEQPVFEMLDRDASVDPTRSCRPFLDALLVLDPDHPDVHARLSEVRASEDGAWILKESASARDRRAELAALAPRILESVPVPRSILPEESELELAGAWRTCFASPRLRVLSTDEGTSAADGIRLAEATLTIFDVALRCEPCAGPRFTIYLLADAGEKERFLARHPAVGPERAAALRRFESFWVLDRSELVVCTRKPEFRIDHILRQTISRELLDHFRLLPESGVLHAGVTSYIASLVRASRPAAGSGSGRADTNLVAHDRIDVRGMLEMRATGLRRGELEASRDLACYLLEGWPGRTADLLTRVGSGSDLDPALRAALGFELSTVEERYARWVKETR